jgi:hypothetical protein
MYREIGPGRERTLEGLDRGEGLCNFEKIKKLKRMTNEYTIRVSMMRILHFCFGIPLVYGYLRIVFVFYIIWIHVPFKNFTTLENLL